MSIECTSNSFSPVFFTTTLFFCRISVSVPAMRFTRSTRDRFNGIIISRVRTCTSKSLGVRSRPGWPRSRPTPRCTTDPYSWASCSISVRTTSSATVRAFGIPWASTTSKAASDPFRSFSCAFWVICRTSSAYWIFSRSAPTTCWTSRVSNGDFGRYGCIFFGIVSSLTVGVPLWNAHFSPDTLLPDISGSNRSTLPAFRTVPNAVTVVSPIVADAIPGRTGRELQTIPPAFAAPAVTIAEPTNAVPNLTGSSAAA